MSFMFHNLVELKIIPKPILKCIKASFFDVVFVPIAGVIFAIRSVSIDLISKANRK